MIKFRVLKLIAASIKASEPEVKKVILSFEDGGQCEYLIMENEIGGFVTANVKLHYKPGKNPHNRNKTTKLLSINIASLVSRGPYWWSTPDLKKNDDKRGTRIWEWSEGKEIWKDGNFLVYFP